MIFTKGKRDAHVAPNGARWIESSTFICLLLVILTLAVFWRVSRCGFINYDDPAYFSSNPQVLAGLTQDGAHWAFVTTAKSSWHPLTWLSYMLDVELFGKSPLGPHLVNLAFHAANVVLLFLLLRQLTGAVWRSALVAALFALHPLRVETVAWVSERKDVLCTLFGLLALRAYARFGRCPKSSDSGASASAVAKARTSGRWWHYGAAVGWFALALMSKPMLVTLPFLMLLLDWWPLERFGMRHLAGQSRTRRNGFTGVLSQHEVWTRLVLEKAPFIALSAILCVVTFVAHRSSGALSLLPESPPSTRLATALVGYVQYLGMTFWPVHLALPYPPRLSWPMGEVILAALALTGLSALSLWAGGRRPYLPTGWFWFVGMLLPVIGLIPTGAQTIADRYTYLPQVGVFVVLVWAAADAAGRLAIPKVLMGLATTGLLLACAIGSRRQLRYWQDSGTLFRRTLEVTGDNALASHQLGCYLMERGQLQEATRCFKEALHVDPHFAMAYDSLGLCLAAQGAVEEAMEYYLTALRINPNDANAEEGLGMAWVSKGERSQAITCFRKALEANPRFVEARNGLGTALAAEGRLDEAIEQYRRAAGLDPSSSMSFHNLGFALANNGQLPEAVEAYTKALRLNPQSDQTRFCLANALAQQGRLEEAVVEYKESLKLNAGNSQAQFNLGYALAQLGRLDEAVACVTESVRLNPDNPEAKQLLEKLRNGGKP